MLNKAKTLKGYTLDSLDGDIGKVKEFYFDDLHWTIRYLVADTGNWLVGRQVLISPHALADVNKEEKNIAINLTKQQIEDSPSLDSDKPVSRHFEEDYYGHYGWPMYWGGPYLWGAYPYIVHDREKWSESTQAEKAWDPHLRCTHEVIGYHIQAEDGGIGHVEDFIVDDQTWAIRYLIIDTQNWWPGKKVLVSPQWIKSVSWGESKVFANLTRETLKQSPEYTEESLLTRDYEAALHRHYERPGYWADEPDDTIPVEGEKTMSDDKPLNSDVYDRAVSFLRKFETEEILFFVIILLSIIGVAITDYAPTASRAYWIFMVAALGTSAVAIEKTLLHRKDVSFTKLWVTQLIHWGVTLVVILLSFTFVKTGRMTNESSGLVILLILSLSTILDGYHVGWRFYLAGIFLGITAFLIAYFEKFMGIMLVIAIAIVVFSIYIERYLTANHNAIKET